LQRLKRDSWTTHLSGAISSDSLGESFTDWWTSSLAATRASRSAQPASDLAPKTHDTSGPTYQPELLSCDQVSVSLKTSRAIAALGFPTCCKTWPEWVTERRGAWRARVNAARLIRGSGSLSWPTIRASEYKDVGPVGSKSHDHMLGKHYLCAVVTQDAATNGQAAPASSSLHGSRQGLSEPSQRNWQTFAHGTHNRGETPHRQVVKALVNGDKAKTQCLTVDQVFAEEIKGTNRQELWLTPRANEPDSDPNFAARNADRGAHCHGTLSSQAKEMWPTITAHTPDMESNGPNGHQGTYLAGAVKQWATPRSGKTTDENPETWALRHAKGDVATMPLGAQVKCWGTPAANDANKTPHCEVNSNQAGLAKSVGLELQRQWGTPTARDHKSGRGNEDRQYKELTPMVERQQTGKLNQAWVCCLMGVPVGWVDPMCPASVIKNWPKFVSGWLRPQTAQIPCDSSAMELCLPPQSELSEFSLAS